MKTSDKAVGQQLKKSIKAIEQELTIAAKILDWEIGDLWGHVGARLPDDKGIAVQNVSPSGAATRKTGWCISIFP